MSPKARPAISVPHSHRRPPRPPNFFQAFSKLFANFCVFSASFSKLLFGGFGEFQRVKGKKIWRQGFSGFSKFLSPAAEEIFAQETTPHRRPPERTDARDPDVKQLKCTLPQILKNRKTFAAFAVGGRRPILAPRPALFGRGGRGNSALFAAAMTTEKRVGPERCRFGRGADLGLYVAAVFTLCKRPTFCNSPEGSQSGIKSTRRASLRPPARLCAVRPKCCILRHMSQIQISKSFWNRRPDGVWAVNGLQGMTLKPKEGETDADFFEIDEDIFLVQPNIIGTIHTFLGESIVPIVSRVRGENLLRCIGTGFS